MKLAKQTKTGNFLLRKQPSPVGEDALPYLRERLAPEFVLARNGEKKKHEEAAKCGGEKGGSEETAPGANCTKPRQECREAGPLFLRSRRERRDPETRATYLCGEG
uniref:uncharacterized protein LOC118537905 isoform X2 n=1 Tax=Halichoerus grypus TaxID=9711 RepID=UPI001659D802|nr:uncharacterized protein LOC118537905 isoform X2 [Halichoerus grypus]